MTNRLVAEFLSECPQWRVCSRIVPVPGMDSPTTVEMFGSGKFALFRWAVAKGVNTVVARTAAGLPTRPDDNEVT